MKAFLADTFSDEEGTLAEEGKTVYLQGAREKLLELCRFFQEVAIHLENAESCHMHFSDSSELWSKQNYIDVVVDVELSPRRAQ